MTWLTMMGLVNAALVQGTFDAHGLKTTAHRGFDKLLASAGVGWMFRKRHRCTPRSRCSNSNTAQQPEEHGHTRRSAPVHQAPAPKRSPLDCRSVPRAAVRTYLIEHGVDAQMLSAKGYGMTAPIADNATPEGRSTNRRVTFTLLDRNR